MDPVDLQHAYRDDVDYHRDRATGLLESARDGTPGAAASFARWQAPLTEDGARSVVAREHGFADWAAFEQHLRGAARVRRSVRAGLRRRRGARPRAAGRAARPVARAGRPSRHERQRPARHGGRDRRRAPRARCCSRAAPTRPAATRTAGRRCTRRPTAAASTSPRCCSRRARRPTSPPAATAARRSWSALFWGHPVPPALVERIGLAPGNLRVAAGLGLTRDDRRAGRPDGTLDPPPEPTAASTGRTAASRSGRRPTIRRRCWTRPSSWAARAQPRRGRRALVERGARPRGRRLPRHAAGVGRRLRPHRRRRARCSQPAPIRAAGRRSAAPTTARV